MLRLLIMLTFLAPVPTVGATPELWKAQSSISVQDNIPLVLSVRPGGLLFLNDTEIKLDDLLPKLKMITDSRGGLDERIFVRGVGDALMQVLGRLSAAGFRRVALLQEQG
jgi:biopolymer transport protein TolR